ncbi:hypothetical protein H1C71_018826, partial [Ictidomys tridecemlineatus]
SPSQQISPRCLWDIRAGTASAQPSRGHHKPQARPALWSQTEPQGEGWTESPLPFKCVKVMKEKLCLQGERPAAVAGEEQRTAVGRPAAAGHTSGSSSGSPAIEADFLVLGHRASQEYVG